MLGECLYRLGVKTLCNVAKGQFDRYLVPDRTMLYHSKLSESRLLTATIGAPVSHGAASGECYYYVLMVSLAIEHPGTRHLRASEMYPGCGVRNIYYSNRYATDGTIFTVYHSKQLKIARCRKWTNHRSQGSLCVHLRLQV